MELIFLGGRAGVKPCLLKIEKNNHFTNEKRADKFRKFKKSFKKTKKRVDIIRVHGYNVTRWRQIAGNAVFIGIWH